MHESFQSLHLRVSQSLTFASFSSRHLVMTKGHWRDRVSWWLIPQQPRPVV
jgi:hypothetical protein